MSAVVQDLRHALKTLRGQPRFVLTAVLTLTIGIGSTTTIFTVVNSVILQPLPYDGDGELVKLVYGDGGERAWEGRDYFTMYDFLDLRDRAESFLHLACYYDYELGGFELTGVGPRPRRVASMRVSADYFEALGAAPGLGRAFSRSEERADSRVVVVSHEFWQHHLKSDEEAVGRTVLLDRVPYTVLGVMPAGFSEPFDREIDLWTVEDLSPQSDVPRDNFYLSVLGRLQPGVGYEEARRELGNIARELAAEQEQTWLERAGVVPLGDEVVGGSGSMLTILLAAVTVLLLVACTNVANLSLASGSVRERELALRMAVGASRWRLVRQLLIENTIVFLIGGLAGLLMAHWGVAVLLGLRPDAVPRIDSVAVDSTVLVFAVVLSLVTGLAFGLVPALRLSGSRLEHGLRASSPTTSHGRGLGRLLRFLVISQTSLAFILLVGAGLLTQSFLRLAGVDPGFSAHNVATFELNLPESAYDVADPTERIELQSEFLDSLESMPGVTAAGAVTRLPLTGEYHTWPYLVERERVPGADRKWYLANIRVTAGNYFEALRVELLKGRRFSAGDASDSTPVIIINRALAQRRFGDVNPIGERILMDGWREIVGVVDDVKTTLRAENPERVYLPYDQYAHKRSWTMTHVVASGREPELLFRDIRRKLSAIDPELVIFNEGALDDVVEAARAREGFASLLVGVFAGAALVLALVGVYGVLACAVSRRSHEIGIRIAVGARRQQIGWTFLSEGLCLTIQAVAIGAVVGFAVNHWLQRLLFEITASDPRTFIGVAVVLTGAAVVISLVPARAATRSDPMMYLRGE